VLEIGKQREDWVVIGHEPLARERPPGHQKGVIIAQEPVDVVVKRN
jgi:hypothetical protein